MLKIIPEEDVNVLSTDSQIQECLVNFETLIMKTEAMPNSKLLQHTTKP